MSLDVPSFAQIVLHPSAILLGTLERINSEDKPDDTDMQMLVAIYCLEVESRVLFETGTFIDPRKIKEILSKRDRTDESFEASLAAVIKIIQSPEVRERMREIAHRTFGSSGRSIDDLIQTIRMLLHEVSTFFRLLLHCKLHVA